LSSLSKVGSSTSDAVWGSGSYRCGRGTERFAHVTLWRCCVREISTDVLVAGTELVLRLANAEADGW
jgi:hypothetical protein